MLEHIVTFDPNDIRSGNDDNDSRDYWGQYLLALNGNIISVRNGPWDGPGDEGYFDYWKFDENGNVTHQNAVGPVKNSILHYDWGSDSWLLDYTLRNPALYQTLMLDGVTFSVMTGWQEDPGYEEGVFLHTFTEDGSGNLVHSAELLVDADAHNIENDEWIVYNSDTNDAFDTTVFEYNGDIYVTFTAASNVSPWPWYQYINRYTRDGSTLIYQDQVKLPTNDDDGSALLFPWKQVGDRRYHVAYGFVGGLHQNIGVYDIGAGTITEKNENQHWVPNSDWTSNIEHAWIPPRVQGSVFSLWARFQGQPQSRHASLDWFAIDDDLDRKTGTVVLPDNNFTYKITAPYGFENTQPALHYVGLRYDLSLNYSPVVVELAWDGDNLSYEKHHMIGDTDGASGIWKSVITYSEADLESVNSIYLDPYHMAVIVDTRDGSFTHSLISVFRVDNPPVSIPPLRLVQRDDVLPA